MATPAAPVVLDTDDLNEIIERVPAAVEETRAGYKTTEFWLTIATSALVVLNGIPMPEKFEGFVVAALGAVYALSRGIAKKGVPNIPAE